MNGGGGAARAALLAAGAARQAEGRFEAAVDMFQKAVALDPGDPGGWAALARCLFAARRPDLALAACDQAAARGVEDAGLLCARAEVLQSLSRVDEAAAAFEAALAREPDRFEARFGLALQAAERGDWAAAEAHVAPLAARDAGLPNLAWLSARIALGRGDQAAARDGLRALIDNPGLPPVQRADALLMLGEALDGLGDAPAAFAAAVQGKAIQRALFAERAAGREGEVAKLRRLEAWFAAADPGPWRTAPAEEPVADAAATHVFLVGFPRSGTTLLEQALAGHSGVVALEEAPTLAEAYAGFMTGPADLARLGRLTEGEAAAWRARYWAVVRDAGADVAGKTFVDKQPAGTLYLPLVAKLFPRAKVLFALRDPRDVALSCLRQAFQMNAMTYAFTDLSETAACYDACMALARRYRALLPLAWRDVRHEALIAEPAGELTALAAWLGLAPEAAMLDVAGTGERRRVRTPSAPQLREGVTTRHAGRWRAYARELAPVMAVLAPWVEAFGYPPGAAG